jgi:hypothetical protein
MRAADSATTLRTRRDGWTAERQLRFLDALARTRSVTKAARAAGMSRESAYRLRARKEGALFTALWDRALQSDGAACIESHKLPLSDGALARLLGTHLRRERGDYARFIDRGRRSGHPIRRESCNF